jgi:hypothetical protein
MNTSDLEGWSSGVTYKSFKAVDNSSSESDSETDEDDSVHLKIKGYNGKKYMKILEVEELIPE